MEPWQKKIRPEGFALQGDLFTVALHQRLPTEQGSVQASYYHGVLSFHLFMTAPRWSQELLNFRMHLN